MGSLPKVSRGSHDGLSEFCKFYRTQHRSLSVLSHSRLGSFSYDTKSEGGRSEQGAITNVCEQHVFLLDTHSNVVAPACLELFYILALSLSDFSSTFSGNVLLLQEEVQK